jgi:hypothetical protein
MIEIKIIVPNSVVFNNVFSNDFDSSVITFAQYKISQNLMATIIRHIVIKTTNASTSLHTNFPFC